MESIQISIRNYLYTGIAVFIIMVITGLLSEVSQTALLTRAILAAILFSVAAWGVVTFIMCPIIAPPEAEPEIQQEPVIQSDAEEQPVRGTQVDIVLPAEESVFEPMAPQQIDPRLNQIINEDPERIASMVKKMGLEE